MSAYSDACAAACRWCAEGYKRWLRWGAKQYEHEQNAATWVACSAPTIEEVTEQQAARIAELEAELSETPTEQGLITDLSALRSECSDQAALVKELSVAVEEQMIRLTDLFDRHERQTYAASSNPDTDLDLILATGRKALSKAQGAALGKRHETNETTDTGCDDDKLPDSFVEATRQLLTETTKETK